jgi:hypothetical protein
MAYKRGVNELGAIEALDREKAQRFDRLRYRITNPIPPRNSFDSGISRNMGAPLLADLVKNGGKREPLRVHPSEAMSWDDVHVPRGYKVVSNYDEAVNANNQRAIRLDIPILGIRGVAKVIATATETSHDYVAFIFNKKGTFYEATFHSDGTIEGLIMPMDRVREYFAKLE